MAVSSRTKGWRWDRTNDRLDFYYNGTRVGHIDANGMDLASGMTYEINTSTATASLDAAYNGEAEIAVDGDAVLLTGTQGTNDVLQITNASGGGACIDLAQSGTGKDIEGTSDTWTVTAAGVLHLDSISTVGVIKFASDTLGTAATMMGYDGTDLVINAVTGKSVDIKINDTAVVTVAGAAITLAQATSVSAGGLTVDAGGLTVSAGATSAITSTAIGLTGVTTITGATAIVGALTVSTTLTVSGNLSVVGNMDWGGNFTVDELILDTDGNVTGLGGSCYIISDNSSDLTLNAITGKEVHIGINSNDELSVSGTEVDIHGNILVLDSDGNTTLDCATGDTVKIYVAGAQDFTITANKFYVEGGSVLMMDDDTLFQLGDGGDTGFVNESVGESANAVVSGITVGTPVTHAVAANSLLIGNITASGDIQVSVNTGGHSQTVLFADSSEGDLYLNAASGGDVFIEVAKAVEYTFGAALLTIASGNDIKFAGDDGILDSDGDELIQFTAATDAINYLQVINAATADPITLQCLGTDDKGFMFEAVNGEEILELAAGTGATTYVRITSANNAPAVISAHGETNTALKFDTAGTGNIIFSLGTVETLAMHDAAITLAAEAATAGHALYMQTEDGGTGSTVGLAGGAWEMRTGDGSAAGGTTNAGGAGAALTLVTGLGGIGTTTGNGGVGGAVAVTSGAGGASVDDGSSVGGVGGSITLTAGAGGAKVGAGEAGAPGAITIGAGIVRYKVQTINMADATVTSTMVPGTPTGTLLTGNILYVDPGGNTEVFKLPHEADCTGMWLCMVNTADNPEDITVQADDASGVLTISQNEQGYLVCNGTIWEGSTGVL